MCNSRALPAWEVVRLHSLSFALAAYVVRTYGALSVVLPCLYSFGAISIKPRPRADLPGQRTAESAFLRFIEHIQRSLRNGPLGSHQSL